MYTLEILYRSIAIAGAIGSLLGGVASIVIIWERSLYLRNINEAGYENNDPDEERGAQMKKIYTIAKILIGSILIILSIISFSFIAQSGQEYRNVILTGNAWKEFNNKEYENAIEIAKDCILEFQGDASTEQERLEKTNAPLPPEGKTTEKEKSIILNRGLLNDVAACWYIIAVSEMKLGNKDKAISAFNKLKKYSYSRVYDPSYDGFWSPANKADSYIKSLADELY